MKRMHLIPAIILLLLIPALNAQHYIGLSKDEVRVAAKNSGFYADNMTISQTFNYIKFVNAPNTKTLIAFFSEDDHCTSTKLVCDYSEYNPVIRFYDREYKRTGKNTWEYSRNKEVYLVKLEEQEWYFTVRTKKK